MEENKNHLEACEYFIPSVVSDVINNKEASVEIVSTTSKWYGITYKVDKKDVVESLEMLMDKGEYPKGLW